MFISDSGSKCRDQINEETNMVRLNLDQEAEHLDQGQCCALKKTLTCIEGRIKVIQFD